MASNSNGLTFSDWLKDDFEQEQFKDWKEDGNVIKMEDGYATQDAQYRNRLKNIYELKKYFYKEFIKGNYDYYSGGGLLEDRVLVAKAIEYITGSSIDESSIQFEANRIAYKYKSSNTYTTISQKLIEDTIYMNRKSLEMRGRFAKGGFATKINKKYKYFAQNKENGKIYDGWEIVDDVESLKHFAKIDLKENDLKPSDFNIISGQALIRKGIDPYNSDNWYKYDSSEKREEKPTKELDFDSTGTSLVMYHEEKGNFITPKGQIYLWLYDVEDGGSKLQSGEYDWVMYPLASMSMAWKGVYIPPLKRIWTKKFQKEHKGSENLLGVVKAYLLKDGEELYIDMMSVNPTKKKKGIMSYMIKDLRDIFNLTQDQVTFSELTPEGEKFVAKKTYADGGWVLVDADTERKLGEYETESEARKMMYEYEGNSNILEKSFFDKLPPNPNRHSPAYNFADGGKVLASSSSKEGINKLIEQYLYGSTITLVQTDNDKIYEVHNKKGKTSFYVELSRGKYKFIQPSMYDNGGDLEENSNRNETQENNFGVSYKLGDKFTLGRKFGNKGEQVSITEIMPSGLFFKVDKSSKVFSIKTLHSRGSTYTSGEYLVPIKKEYADGGHIPHEDKMFQLPLEMVVYVPSTQDVDKVISVDEMDSRVDEVKQYLASKFGGYSSADKLGGFVDSKGNLVNEDVVQVTSFSTKEAYEEHKEELIQQLAKWGKQWGQEAIGFEFEGDLMYVPQELKNETKVDKYKRGGFMYEVQKKGSPSNDMKETMFTAKNLKELKKRVIEKYGTSEGFLVSRRTEQGYYVPVKFEDGGAIYPDLSLEKADVVNDSVELDEFKITKTKTVLKSDKFENLKILSSQDVANVLRKLFDSDTINAYEQAFILFLNKSNKINGYYHHSSGGIDGTVMDIQMISGMALKSLSKGVIIAHNHPSGNINPSESDKEITKQLKEALELFNIKLMDSIILTDSSYFSFADEYLL